MKPHFLFPIPLALLQFASVLSHADTASNSHTKFANNTILSIPKVDGEGYVTQASKMFYITVPNASPGDSFEVNDVKGNLVLQGNLSSKPIDDMTSSGETVLSGDFTALNTDGTYQVVVGTHESAPFTVAVDPYFEVFRDSARSLSLIRCGAAINDPETGINHPICHIDDAAIRGTQEKADFTGGWHNAGDYGKWTHEASIASSLLMWTYTLGSPNVRDETLDIGEADSNIPDLLSEAKWGLTWLFKMQRTDGSVYHKVDSEPNFAWGKKPNEDFTTRSAAEPCTVDTADFTAVMAQASVVFKPFDPDFAERCRVAASKSWAWTQAHPGVVNTDPYYKDSDPSQEIIWAQCEMACITRDKTLIAAVREKVANSTPNELMNSMPDSLGFLALEQDTNIPADIRHSSVAGLERSAAKYEAIAAKTGYSVALASQDYTWGSNETLLGRACIMLFASAGDHQLIHREFAVKQLHYLLGCNSLGISYITKHGVNPIQNPYHWIWFDYHVMLPGWATGGSNQYTNGADSLLVDLIGKGTPPAKCYVDKCEFNGSWASNEGELDEEAMLIFVSGMFSGNTVDGPTLPS